MNYADVTIRWGLYESALRHVGWPIVPGFDVAGTVEAAGIASGFKTGDQVSDPAEAGVSSARALSLHDSIAGHASEPHGESTGIQWGKKATNSMEPL